MKPAGFSRLLTWMFREYKTDKSIFGIPREQFFKENQTRRLEVFGKSCCNAIGPAAGPHTQLSQNIISAYLCGGRFFELKTVQILDQLEVEKPCINAADECYNTEWSQELDLKSSLAEYLDAWFGIHLLESLLGHRNQETESFVFNMSVGYDLAGIKKSPMDNFINSMQNAPEKEFISRQRELNEFVSGLAFNADEYFDPASLSAISEKISPCITNSVTLSTMHGCPPGEIEEICAYMLREKNLDTYVKLNPTLLGFERVREILDRLEYDYLQLDPDAFAKDLKLNDALPMLVRLQSLAKRQGRKFGIKLTNTLGTVNPGDTLPGSEMYMSGRSLYPLAINLASLMADKFSGKLPISFSAGVSEFNAVELMQSGIRPLTMATDLLKPGGYGRLSAMAKRLSMGTFEIPDELDKTKIRDLAADSLLDKRYTKSWRSADRAKINSPLPLQDCYLAPCVEACPVKQDVPEYLRLVGQGRYKDALELIYTKNALPHTTGYICDHQCEFNCTRLDYEGSLKIREMKLIAAERGWDEFISTQNYPEVKYSAKIAIVGAGAAGLSAALFLARSGFSVCVYEQNLAVGGIISHLIPGFRVPEEAVNRDIEFIKAHGVEFKTDFQEDFKLTNLREAGYEYILMATGAARAMELNLDGNRTVQSANEFLLKFNKDITALNLDKEVVVVGAGNTAMDCARAALRVKGVEKVSIVYRRTQKEMPADPEELELALADGIEFKTLLNPLKYDSTKTLYCQKMKLGDPGADGRRSPLAIDEFLSIKADYVFSAIGDKIDLEFFNNSGLESGANGKLIFDPHTQETAEKNVFILGDASNGPATIIGAVADAKRAAACIIKREDPHAEDLFEWPGLENLKTDLGQLNERRAKLIETTRTNLDLNKKVEALRCLDCNIVCNKCVDVCPNRANLAIAVSALDLRDKFQIIHLDDYCNECGNCETFCPYMGDPCKDKFTLFSSKRAFENSTNEGFFISEKNKLVGILRLKTGICEFSYSEIQGIQLKGDTNKDVCSAFNTVSTLMLEILENYIYLL
jgi:putative selenate reductase